MKKIKVLIGVTALAVTMFFTGCKTTPQRVAYQSTAATALAVPAALQAYDVFAKAGKTTVEQNQQVAAAFVKYQAAFKVASDALAVYLATDTSTNSPAVAAYTQAAANSRQTLADLNNLINSFNLK